MTAPVRPAVPEDAVELPRLRGTGRDGGRLTAQQRRGHHRAVTSGLLEAREERGGWVR
ncbi:hypothetical protein [Kitasatospora herbaricolor]|uniref:Uncharacterized protein n=1 Tax=Kitasatospora herbaricolor TaxID=68217 RepID=A0ABZ1WGZ3_9ACTN|nr:hypothetical protein [Kitasatospora herbaricolor]